MLGDRNAGVNIVFAEAAARVTIIMLKDAAGALGCRLAAPATLSLEVAVTRK